MAKKQSATRLVGRDSRTGQFVPLRETRQRPATTQRERIPLPGYGDTARYGAKDLSPDVPPPPPAKKKIKERK